MRMNSHLQPPPEQRQRRALAFLMQEPIDFLVDSILSSTMSKSISLTYSRAGDPVWLDGVGLLEEQRRGRRRRLPRTERRVIIHYIPPVRINSHLHSPPNRRRWVRLVASVEGHRQAPRGLDLRGYAVFGVGT